MDGLFATISTNKGDIKIELFYQEVPGTVGNFAGLSWEKSKIKLRILEFHTMMDLNFIG